MKYSMVSKLLQIVLPLALAIGALPAQAIDTTAKQAVLIDYNTGGVLFEKNADELMPPSSMSKMMTVYMVFERLKSEATRRAASLESFQSNAEHELVDRVQALATAPVDYAIINPGAFTHTSIALHDCIKAIRTPVIEVHLSNPHTREDFRHLSYVGRAAKGTIAGFGALSYLLALEAAARL